MKKVLSLTATLIFILSIGLTAMADSGSWLRVLTPTKGLTGFAPGKVIVTEDKGYLAVGCNYDNNGYKDGAVVVKVGASGKVQWSRVFRNGTVGAEFISAVELADDSLVLVGHVQPAGSKSLNSGVQGPWNVLAVKLQKDGRVLWQKIYQKTGEFFDSYALNISDNDDGSLVITGQQMHYIDGYGRTLAGYAMTLDAASGAVKSVIPIGDALGSACFAFANDDGYVIAKPFSVPGWANAAELFKYDGKGAIKWLNIFVPVANGTRLYGSNTPKVYSVEEGYVLVQDVRGYDAGGKEIKGMAVMKVSESGAYSWGRLFSGFAGDAMYNISFEQTRDGGFVLVNRSGSDTLDEVVLKLGGDGVLEWARSLPQRASFANVIQGAGQELVVTGHGQAGSFLGELMENGELNLAGLEMKTTKVDSLKTVELKAELSEPDLSGMKISYQTAFAVQDVNLLIDGAGYGDGQLYPLSASTGASGFAVKAAKGAFDFGAVKAGAKSKEQLVTLTNTGGKAVKLGRIVLGGAGAKEFTCSLKQTKTSLGAGATTTVSVVFAPKGAGAKAATLTIFSSNGKEKTVVKLGGTGK